MSRRPSPTAIAAAVAAARGTRRTNYTAAARALNVTRAELLALLGVQETRGAPRVNVTPAQAAAAKAQFPDSTRTAAKHLRISQSTYRALLARAAS